MGKNVVLTSCDTHNLAAHHPTISRQEFLEVIEEALTAVKDRHGADAQAVIAEPIRQLARTTDKIDANAWKCVDSCGCPLTAAGFNKPDASPNFRSLFPDLANPASIFHTTFDVNISRRLGLGQNAMTITITD